jgi:Flp pilus assembly pilin Flp
MKAMKKLFGNTRGAAAVELALIFGLMVVGLLASVGNLGTEVQSSYNDTATKISDATAAAVN